MSDEMIVQSEWFDAPLGDEIAIWTYAGHIIAMCEDVTDAYEVVGTRERLIEAERLLLIFVDNEDTPCRFDHHGNCQEHRGDKPCSVAAARAFLADSTLRP